MKKYATTQEKDFAIFSIFVRVYWIIGFIVISSLLKLALVKIGLKPSLCLTVYIIPIIFAWLLFKPTKKSYFE